MNFTPDHEAVQKLVDEGLLTLINMTILWPRGLALRVHYDDTDTDQRTPVGFDVYDAGEYIAGFIDDEKNKRQLADRMAGFIAAELDREAKATAGSDG